MIDGLDLTDFKINTWVTQAAPQAHLWVLRCAGAYMLQEFTSQAPARSYLLTHAMREVVSVDDVCTRAGGRLLVVKDVNAVALDSVEVALFRAWNALYFDRVAAACIVSVGVPIAAYGIAVAAEVLAFTGDLSNGVASYVTAVNVAVQLHGHAALLGVDPVLVARVVATAGSQLGDAMVAAMAIAG